MADIFLHYKEPFGKFPLIAGFSLALIGAIHSTVWEGRRLIGGGDGGGVLKKSWDWGNVCECVYICVCLCTRECVHVCTWGGGGSGVG